LVAIQRLRQNSPQARLSEKDATTIHDLRSSDRESGLSICRLALSSSSTLSRLFHLSRYIQKTLYGIEHKTIASCSLMAERDFYQVEQDLEHAISKLKATEDPKLRHQAR